MMSHALQDTSIGIRLRQLMDKCDYYYKKICTYDGLINDVAAVKESLKETLDNSTNALQIAKSFDMHLKAHDNDINHIRDKINSESERTDIKCNTLQIGSNNLQEKLDSVRIEQHNKIESLNQSFHENLNQYVSLEEIHLLKTEIREIVANQSSQIRQLCCLVDDLEAELLIQKEINNLNVIKFQEIDKQLARLKNEIFRVSYKQENKI